MIEYTVVTMPTAYLIGMVAFAVVFSVAAIQSLLHGRRGDFRIEALLVLASPAWLVLILGGVVWFAVELFARLRARRA